MISPPITKPGVFLIPADTYLADACCDAPSLNAGIIDDLIDECPRIAWENHPRLNPAHKPKTIRHFDIGKAGHLLLLEPELFYGSIGVIDADDYKAGWAQDTQREIRAEGKVPLLVRERDTLIAMRAALRENDEIERALREGKPERGVFAKDPRYGIWRRCKPDLLAHHGGWLMDVKIVISANPKKFGKIAGEFNWQRRAAWYTETFEMATGVLPKVYWFAMVSKEKPFLATLNSLEFEDLDSGQQDCAQAVKVFSECLARGTDEKSWPGYRDPRTPDRDSAFRSALPGYVRMAASQRHEEWAEAEIRRLHYEAGRPISGE